MPEQSDNHKSLPTKEEVSQRLGDALHYRSMSAIDLTRALGRNDHAVNKWMNNGKSSSASMPSFFNLVQVCRVLDLNLYYFINPDVAIEDYDMRLSGHNPHLIEGMSDEDATLSAIITSLPRAMKQNIKETVGIFVSTLGGVGSASPRVAHYGDASVPQNVVATGTYRFIAKSIMDALESPLNTPLILKGYSGIGKTVAAKVTCFNLGLSYLDATLIREMDVRSVLSINDSHTVCIDNARYLTPPDLEMLQNAYEGGARIIYLLSKQLRGSDSVLSDMPIKDVRDIPGLEYQDALLVLNELGYPLKHEVSIRLFQRTTPSLSRFLSIVNLLQDTGPAEKVTIGMLSEAFAASRGSSGDRPSLPRGNQ
jgi:hypothetical protein